MKLKIKIFLQSVLLMLLLFVIVFSLLSFNLMNIHREYSIKSSQVETIALAIHYEKLILLHEYSELETLLQLTVDNIPIYEYIFIEDRGVPISHTFSKGVPLVLFNLHDGFDNGSMVNQFQDQNDDIFYDIEVKGKKTDTIFHYGISQNEIDKEAYIWLSSLAVAFSLVFLASVFLSYNFATIITRKEMKKSIELRKSQLLLKEGEEKFRTVADFTYDWEYWVNPQGKCLYVSPSCKRITGYTANEFLQDPELLLSIIHSDDVHFVKNHIHKVLKSGELDPIEFRIITKSGKERWIGHLCQTVYNNNGLNLGQRGSNRDITELKQAEEQITASLTEKEVLLREIHHRVKNNMQIIISLLRIHSRRIKDKRLHHVFDDCRDRINAMSLIHEALYQSEDLSRIDFNLYLRKLCQNMSSVYSTTKKDISVNVKACEVILGIDQGIAVGTIVAELIGNAYKHAFFERKKGSVSISMLSNNEEQVKLIVEDDGVGLPEEINLRELESFGLKLTVSTVARNLNGSFEVERNHGTKFIICFKPSGL